MPKILVVDDEEPIRALFSSILLNEGHPCVLARNAEEARAKLEENSFDVVISDVRMPGESGLDLLRHVLTKTEKTAVILASVLDDRSVVNEAIKLGVHGYIVKPFNPKGVLITIQNALHRLQLENDNRHYRANLERLVSERTTELKKINSELASALKKIQDAQAHMVHSEKMASIGQLAAGVAHEINNPVGFVGSNLNTLAQYHTDLVELIGSYRELVREVKDSMGKNPGIKPLTDCVARIESLEGDLDIDYLIEDGGDLIQESIEGSDRIKKIVADLKDFAHPGEDKVKPADINKNIESTLNVVWNELKYKAEVAKDFGELPYVVCHPHQLNQVFMNILVNAAQAIENQGEIFIATRAIGDEVKITFTDTGCGIPKDKINRIFEPFYTTKEVGKGTGLGLHLAYNIIQKHNGSIEVKSDAGIGTTFTIRLPVNEAASEMNDSGEPDSRQG